MKNNWLLILQGIFAILFGIIVVLFPIKSLIFITWLVGAFLFVESIILILFGIFDKKIKLSSVLLEGAVGIVAGLAILNWPSITFRILVLFFALWSIITGIIEIVRAKDEEHDRETTSIIVFAGLTRFLLGMLLLVFPQLTIGISQIFFGLTMIVVGIGSIILVAKSR